MSVKLGDTDIAGLVEQLPSQTGNAGKYLYTDGTNASWEEASTSQIWIGTRAEYDALESHDPEVTYQITDDFPRIQPFHKEVADRNIGELVYSLIPLTDAGLHVLNGELLPGEGIYEDFYNYMLSIAVNHPQLFTTEEAWQTSVQTYGVCGKFVIDTANSTIRLPKVTGFVEGTIVQSELGDLVEAGLPDHSHTQVYKDVNYKAPYGSANRVCWEGTEFITVDTGLASVNNSIYGNSDTVQPQAIKGYIYIVLANTVKTEIEVDIDNVATDLDNKVTKGHEVIEFQAPTADNNYTWYRKYADGWVEQGGQYVGIVGVSTGVSITLPVTMTDANYTLNITGEQNSSNWAGAVIQNGTRTTTGFQAYVWGGGSGDQIRGLCWVVQGMAA